MKKTYSTKTKAIPLTSEEGKTAPDGTETWTFPGGAIAVQSPDGTKTVTHPDGKIYVFAPDGTVTVIHNGRVKVL